MTVLLKEFQDIQIRYGVNSQDLSNELSNNFSTSNDDGCHTNEVQPYDNTILYFKLFFSAYKQKMG